MIEYIVVSIIGVSVGAGELLARYRDEPLSAICTWSGIGYVLLNGLMASGALYLVDTFEIFAQQANAGGAPAKTAIYRVLTSGLCSMAVFRSSLFNVRVGDQEVGVGPAIILQTYLRVIDRRIDRVRSLERDKLANELASGLAFERSYESLPAYCLALMQNLSSGEQQQLATAVAAINGSHQTDDAKMRLLILELVKLTGDKVLRQAIDTLGESIRSTPTP